MKYYYNVSERDTVSFAVDVTAALLYVINVCIYIACGLYLFEKSGGTRNNKNKKN